MLQGASIYMSSKFATKNDLFTYKLKKADFSWVYKRVILKVKY